MKNVTIMLQTTRGLDCYNIRRVNKIAKRLYTSLHIFNCNTLIVYIYTKTKWEEIIFLKCYELIKTQKSVPGTTTKQLNNEFFFDSRQQEIKQKNFA